MDIEKNRAIIVPLSQHHGDGNFGKSRDAATGFIWANKPFVPQQQVQIDSRTSNIRRNSLNQRNLAKNTKLCYRFLDLVIVMCIVFPLAIAFWRGVWQLMDYHSVEWEIDPWLSMAVGYSIPLVLHLFQEPLKRNICVEKMSFPLFYLLTRIILLLHSFGSVNQWRGLWVWMDIEMGKQWESAAGTLLIGILISLPFKTLNNILAPPLFCFVDEASSVHDCPLRFRTSTRKPFQYFMDCVFSVIIVPGFVVFCWRGLWTLADLFLFPESELHSALASLGIGYTICIILCICQASISKKAQNLKGITRLAFMNTICVVAFVGCLLAWRGVWNSYNIFLIFETITLSDWVTTVAGALGTMFLGCISTVVVRGIGIDGELIEDGTGDWLIPYISLIDTPVFDVPFPEPWVCRFLCTSQKVTGRNRRQGVKDGKLDPVVLDGDSLKPLKISNALSNSVHKTVDDDYTGAKKSNDSLSSFNKLHLNDLPNIDSSSEEELGMRTKMIPSPDYNEEDEQNEQQRHQTA